MFKRNTMSHLTVWWSLIGLVAGAGCVADEDALGTSRHEVADVPHTTVERQSIGNCWLYAQASWVESLHMAAQGEELDVSQSYWTYWHWFDQVTGYMWDDEISTGGNQWESHSIVRDRGLMRESDFVPEDENGEMSNRQSAALSAINAALSSGELSTEEARRDGRLVRRVFDEAWQLSDEVRAQLDQVFGEDGEGTLRQGGSVEGTKIIDPGTLSARYTERTGSEVVVHDTVLLDAIREWKVQYYPSDDAGRRAFQQRVQRALHERQPVVITWDVDFNAMENGQNERRGSFNLQTLVEAGRPGRQGGHMTVLEDYAAETEEFGLLEAGVTLDPEDPTDAAKLEAALLPSTRVLFFRTKNSWGALRPDRASAPGFPGYHDLWMDYLNGPIPFCPSVTNPTNETCTGESNPLRSVMLPPGY